jgi:H+/Cl- antiporter ClcA
MLRVMMAAAIVLLALGIVVVGYNVLIVGTGLVGALALLHSYWRDAVSDSGTTQNFQWMAIVVAALLLAWRAGYMRDPARYQ